MKPLILTIFLCFSLNISCFSQIENQIIGVWELVKGEFKTQDSNFNYPESASGKHMKIITKSHFTTVWVDSSHTGNSYPGFNGGSYTLKDGIYTEIQHYLNDPNSLGRKSYYSMAVKGDRLFMTPVTEEGKAKKFGFFEEWKKVE